MSGISWLKWNQWGGDLFW